MQVPDITLCAGGRSICKPGIWEGSGEWSNVVKLYHVIDGCGWVGINGKRFALKAGRLRVIPPHAMLSHGAVTEITVEWLHFRFGSAWMEARLGSLARVYLFGKNVTARWASVCRLIPRCIEEPSRGETFLVHAMLLELVGLILARLPPESPNDRLARERLLPALNFIDANAMRHPSLSDIARTVSLSPEHFHRLFRTVFNTTPHQYMYAGCMVRAEQLLSAGGHSVKEIAQQCGYDDPFYFSRVFRRHFGVSPGKVRQSGIPFEPKP